MCEGPDPPAAAEQEEFSSPRSGGDARDASVCRIGYAAHEPLSLESGHQPSHGRGTHLFRRRELAERPGSGKHHNREDGESRRGESGRVILPSQASQELNGR